MLADDRALLQPAGRLNSDLRLAETWRDALADFIAGALPAWRDDPERPAATAEASLTSQLSGFLNSRSRLSNGWDILQFRIEEPDEIVRGRSIDLVAAPSGVRIWIEGRRYSQYETLLPVECKRLPTPSGSERDVREYLHSRHGLRGGVQRFKAGVHGAAHDRAAMIAYLQSGDISAWSRQVAQWIEELSASQPDWTPHDALRLDRHDVAARTAQLSSSHARKGLKELNIDHLWIEM